MQFNKKLSKSGALTIPAALRRQLGIGHGEKFSIAVEADGNITMKRTQGNCIFCKSEERLATYHGRFVCQDCVENMYVEKEDVNDGTC